MFKQNSILAPTAHIREIYQQWLAAAKEKDEVREQLEHGEGRHREEMSAALDALTQEMAQKSAEQSEQIKLQCMSPL